MKTVLENHPAKLVSNQTEEQGTNYLAQAI
jgi:hypothetical protein